MKHKVLVIDTNVLCVWLKVPGMPSTGPAGDAWDHARIEAEIQRRIADGYKIVLPISVIVETGNHITKACKTHTADATAAQATFAANVQQMIDGTSPWIPWYDQPFDSDKLRAVMDTWSAGNAFTHLAIGDIFVDQVCAEYTKMAGYEVVVFTKDRGLQDFLDTVAPVAGHKSPQTPRRKQ